MAEKKYCVECLKSDGLGPEKWVVAAREGSPVNGDAFSIGADEAIALRDSLESQGLKVWIRSVSSGVLTGSSGVPMESAPAASVSVFAVLTGERYKGGEVVAVYAHEEDARARSLYERLRAGGEWLEVPPTAKNLATAATIAMWGRKPRNLDVVWIERHKVQVVDGPSIASEAVLGGAS